MSERLKSYFRHYRSERRGVIVFVVLLLLAIAVSEFSMRRFNQKSEPFRILLIDESHEGDVISQEQKKTIPEAFTFDPNALSDSAFLALGFSNNELQTFRNYLAAGGRFRVKKDFAKLYFVNDQDYKRLQPFIALPDTLIPKPKKFRKTNSFDLFKSEIAWSDTADTSAYRYRTFICNINTADTNELKKLKGIGSFYAREIVEYRDELGGYHSLAQLLEIWKMSTEKIDGFADHILIKEEDLRRISINEASAYELSRHPYVSFELASKIVLKREEISGFRGADRLCGSGLLDAELCRKLVPYLNFDQ